MRAAATIVGLALFAGLLWYGLSQEVRVECDACFTFKGRTECRVGRGDSEDTATRQREHLRLRGAREWCYRRPAMRSHAADDGTL